MTSTTVMIASPYFSVLEPAGDEVPVVVEVPHAGLTIDAPSLAYLTAPARAIGRDADLYVDELYENAPSLGATLIASRVSRYVCDLNRSEDDVDATTVEGGPPRRAPHGLLWRTTTDGIPAIAGPLPRTELNRRLNDIYRPYHRAVREVLHRKLERFGYALLICGHSMPSRGLGPGGEVRADVVPGSQGWTTAHESLIRVPEAEARHQGWSVAHDRPYRGGFSTRHYGRPGTGVHAVQIELARRLYMDELRLTKKPGDFEKVRRYCAAVVQAAARLDKSALLPRG